MAAAATADAGVEIDRIKQFEDENFTAGVSTANAGIEVGNTEQVENESVTSFISTANTGGLKGRRKLCLYDRKKRKGRIFR